MTRTWSRMKTLCCSPMKVCCVPLASLHVVNSNSASLPEAQLDLEDEEQDRPAERSKQLSVQVEKKQVSRTAPQDVRIDQSHAEEEKEVHVQQQEQQQEEETVHLQSTPEPQQQHCQSTVAEQDPDEDRVSSTNECPKDSGSEIQTSATQVSNSSDTSPSSKRRDELDYSSYDNGEWRLHPII